MEIEKVKPAESHHELSEQSLQEAQRGLERLEKRFKELQAKEKLTEQERRELELITNNVMVIQEMIAGNRPEEFEEIEEHN